MVRVNSRILFIVFFVCFVILEYRFAYLLPHPSGQLKGSHAKHDWRRGNDGGVGARAGDGNGGGTVAQKDKSASSVHSDPTHQVARSHAHDHEVAIEEADSHHEAIHSGEEDAHHDHEHTHVPEANVQSHHGVHSADSGAVNKPQKPRFKTPPPTSGKKHPNFPNGASVPIQYPVFPHRFTDRQKRVVAALMHGWDNYVKDAWGHDELLPGRSFSDWGERWSSNGGIALTAIEALPTLWIMGKEDEVKKVVTYLEKQHTFDKDLDIGLFETTIRCLGGLLSGYELTGIPVFLDKANDLGNRLMNAFRQKGKNKIPFATINLQSGHAANPGWLMSQQSLSEVTTIQLEFKKLSYFTGDRQYDDAAQGVMQAVLSHLPSMHPKLFPMFIGLQDGNPMHGTATLGARGDSFYEYLVKQWVLTNRTEKWLEEAWDGVGDAIHKHMLVQIDDTRAFLAEVSLGGNNEKMFKMDHLVCFTPGMYLLGLHGTAEKQARDKKLAADVARTCYNMYAMNPTGIGSEIVKFHGQETGYKMYITGGDTHYILRPEAIESQFYLYRFTRDKEWVENGWKMFEAIEKHCKVAGGWAGLSDVTRLRSTPRDKMESFFLAETLKYSFLLQADPDMPDPLPLDEWVFNTEAHPMRVMQKPLKDYDKTAPVVTHGSDEEE